MSTITLSVLFSLSTALVVGSFTLFVRSGQRHANAVSGVLIGLIVSMPPLLVGAVWTWEPAHYQPSGLAVLRTGRYRGARRGQGVFLSFDSSDGRGARGAAQLHHAAFSRR